VTGLPNDGARRVALVIGNDRYESLPSLQKAVNDARAMGDTLTRLGFEVLRLENAPRRTMNQKLVEFTGKIGRGDTAFFFFAGHGIEIRASTICCRLIRRGARQRGGTDHRRGHSDGFPH